VSPLREVVAALLDVDPTLAAYVAADPPRGRYAGRIADPDRLFTLEAVREGYLLHYGEPAVLTGMEPDLRLLVGDALYALGLSRVAEAGDLAAVAELSDLISATARAHAEGDGDRAETLWAESAHRLA
jgi:hypothetical protein